MPEPVIKRPVVISSAPAATTLTAADWEMLIKALAPAIVKFVRETAEEVAHKAIRDGEIGVALRAYIRTAVADALTASDAAADKATTIFVRGLIAEELSARFGEDTVLTDGGVWSAEKRFRKGAVATYGGNIWICQQPNRNEQPGRSDYWRLPEKTKGRR